MRVLLVRHAAAISQVACSTDEVRWLTTDGRATARRVGRALAELGLPITCIYTSPLVRAVQTAEILADTTSFTGPLEVHEPLALERGTTAQALSPLDHAGDDDVVVLVTHEPKIRVLAGHLCGLRGFPGFQTAGACLVEYERVRQRGRFQWMLDPETLARATDVSTIGPH